MQHGQEFEAAGYQLPQFDYEKVLDKGMENMLNEYYVKRERANSTSVLSSYSDEEQIAETE